MAYLKGCGMSSSTMAISRQKVKDVVMVQSMRVNHGRSQSGARVLGEVLGFQSTVKARRSRFYHHWRNDSGTGLMNLPRRVKTNRQQEQNKQNKRFFRVFLYRLSLAGVA